MFVGHFAVGLAAKRAAPRINLGALFISCQLLDLIWPVLVLAGVERVSVVPGITAFNPLRFDWYPWSHSLVMSLLWSALAFGLARALRASTLESAVVGALVFSHWVLDLASHRPDLPLWIAEAPVVGLGLWDSVAATVIVETLMFAFAVVLYVRTTKANDGHGRWGLWSLIGFLALIHFGNAFGPKPPADTPSATIAGPALSMWLLVAWAYDADRHRTVALAG